MASDSAKSAIAQLVAQTRQNIVFLQELEQISCRDAEIILSKLCTTVPSRSDFTFKARAKRPYDGYRRELLYFVPGDILEVVEELSTDWWRGRLNAVEGIFPSSYVERLSYDVTSLVWRPFPPPQAYYALPDQSNHYSPLRGPLGPPSGPAAVMHGEHSEKKSGRSDSGLGNRLAHSTVGGADFATPEFRNLKQRPFDLPQEVLRLIFQRAIPPYFLLDTTLSKGPHSSWCKTLRLMKSLVLVCRTWYHVGVTFLYEYICIRRFSQLECLCDVFEHSSLSQLVKYLDIQCYIPEDLGSELDACLRTVTEHCPSLTSFGFSTPCDLPPSAIEQTNCLPPCITHLRLDSNLKNNQISSILDELGQNLIAFHFQICLEPEISTTFLAQQDTSFPQLRNLSIFFSNQDSARLKELKCAWCMPALQHLTILAKEFRNFNRDVENFVVSLVRAHSRELLHLNIGSNLRAAAFKSVLESCPRLERLVIHPYALLEEHWTVNRFFHPKLRWIDFIHFRHEGSQFQGHLRLSKEELPSLRGIRHIFNSPRHLSNWIDELQPQQDRLVDFEINLFHQELVHSADLMPWRYEPNIRAVKAMNHRQPEPILSAIWDSDDSDDKDDSDYIPSSSDSSSGSSSDELSWSDEDGI